MHRTGVHTWRTAAFTLIELLVVIAIIAILAAILFPVFSEARESARQARCQSNLRQIGAAIRMYMDDWNNKFPDFPWRPDPAYEGDQHYFGAAAKMLLPYAKGKYIFRCISQPENPPGWETERSHGKYSKHIQTYTWTNENGREETIRCDYEFEMGVEMLDARSLDFPFRDEGMWGMDRLNEWNPAAYCLVCDYPCNYHTIWPLQDAIAPHRGGMCVLFADFHVIWTNKPNDEGRNSFDGNNET